MPVSSPGIRRWPPRGLLLSQNLSSTEAEEHTVSLGSSSMVPARRPDVLVVILAAGREVVAVTAAGDRAAAAPTRNMPAIGRKRGDRVQLAIGSDVARRLPRAGRKPAGDVFDRAADRVAAVQRSLRAAQHFDPFDVVDVEHRALRAVEVDVVEIEADALLEAGDRILLADAADEGGQRRVGAARGFERDVRRGVADVGDVERALALELLAGIAVTATGTSGSTSARRRAVTTISSFARGAPAWSRPWPAAPRLRSRPGPRPEPR